MTTQNGEIHTNYLLGVMRRERGAKQAAGTRNVEQEIETYVS